MGDLSQHSQVIIRRPTKLAVNLFKYRFFEQRVCDHDGLLRNEQIQKLSSCVHRSSQVSHNQVANHKK